METYMVLLNVLMWTCIVFVIAMITLSIYLRQIKKQIKKEMVEYDTYWSVTTTEDSDGVEYRVWTKNVSDS